MSTLTISDINTKVNGAPRVLDTKLAKALGFQNALMIRKTVKRNMPALERLGEVFSTVEKTTKKGGRPSEAFYLTEKQALYLCTKSQAEKAIDITIRMVELFYQVRNGHQPTRLARTDETPDAVVMGCTYESIMRRIDSVQARLSELSRWQGQERLCVSTAISKESAQAKMLEFIHGGIDSQMEKLGGEVLLMAAGATQLVTPRELRSAVRWGQPQHMPH